MISVFDTTICDDNLGNEIIMEAVYSNLLEIFPEEFYIKLPYLDRIEKNSIQYIKQSQYTFFGGTNSLSSNMMVYNQWGLDLENCEKIKDVILMGLGWWQYQERADMYTTYILNTVLNKKYIHSVRDNYTKHKLNEIGISNVINTGCPTIWGLNQEHCKAIPKEKANEAIITFTNYGQNRKDREWVDIVTKHYEKVYVWIQGPQDLLYAKSMGENFEIIGPNVSRFNQFLQTHNVDYIGTRLHAGIRALQYKKRTIILSIDNRANEMGRDFNLPVIDRDDVDILEQMIQNTYITDICIPIKEIQDWKKQFKY